MKNILAIGNSFSEDATGICIKWQRPRELKRRW